MADKFDRYREALVIETQTTWPPECESLSAEEKASVARLLHASPESCVQLEYVRQHTGFCRLITVTPEDLQRVRRGY